MRNDQPIEDFEKRLIYEDMARSSPLFNQNLETSGCLIKLQLPSTPSWNLTGFGKAELDQLKSETLSAPLHVRPPVSVRQDPPQLRRRRQ